MSVEPNHRAGSLAIEIFPGVYMPQTDTELLLQAVGLEAPGEDDQVLEIFAGTGIVALTAALSGATVTAVDRDKQAVANVRWNAAANGLSVEVRRGDIFGAVRDRRFNSIFANPPYVPEPPGDSYTRGLAWDGGPDGRSAIDVVCDGARDHLLPGGALYMVHSSLAGIESTVRRLEANDMDVETVIEHEQALGPISVERLQYLEEQGFVGPGCRSERLCVVRANPRLL